VSNAKQDKVEAGLARMRREIVPRMEDFAAEMNAGNRNTMYPREQKAYADKMRAIEYAIATYGERLRTVDTVDRAHELYILVQGAYMLSAIHIDQGKTALTRCAGFISEYVDIVRK
jgi:hypothetical protein